MDTPKPEMDLQAVWASVAGILFSVSLFNRVLVTVGISDLGLALALLVGVQRGEWRRWWELRQDSLARWVFGFATSVVIGFIVGRLRLGHLIWWALVNRGLGLLLVISIYCIFASAPKRQVWFYLRCFVVAGSLLNLLGLAAVVLRYACDYGSVFFFGHTSLRFSGLVHNPNTYGGYLAALLSVQLTAVAFGKSLFGRLWMDITNIGALLLASVFTISRGSWLATLIGTLAVLVVARAAPSTASRRLQLAIPTAVAVCLTVLLLIARTGGLWPALRLGPHLQALQDSSSIYFPHGGPLLSEFLRVASDPTGAGDRLTIMRTALQLYTASPSTLVLGLGLGGFAEIAPTSSLRSSVIIHNSFLWALVELGPLGAICLLGIFQATLRKLWGSLRAGTEATVVSATLFVALISVLAWCVSNDGAYQRHLWFLLGLATATAAAVRAGPGPEKPTAEIL